MKMRNNGLTQAVGISDVRLETSNGTRLVLNNAKHIPNIHLNLISTSKLDDEGYCSTFSNGQWKLTKDSLVVARGENNSSLYIM